MTPLELLMRSDVAVVLAGSAALVGWLTGCAFVVALFWRRLTHPIGGEVLLWRREANDARIQAVELRGLVDDLEKRLGEKDRLIEEQTRQIGQLYKDVDKMALLAVTEAAKAHERGAA